MKVDILIFILEYPGIGEFINVTGSGSYSGCVWCDIHGKSIITILHSSTLNHNFGEPHTVLAMQVNSNFFDGFRLLLMYDH